MRVTARQSAWLSRLRDRLSSEDGFTIIIALGVLVVTSLLAAAAYAAVQADAPLAQRDLSGKRAYYAARAGLNEFLYELNQNPKLWETCPQQPTKTPIAPSSVTGPAGSTEYYTYKYVPANGYADCTPADQNGDPISELIDADTQTFQMLFTGYAGSPEVSRGLIASFRKDTPLDYLWFTIYETLDPATYPTPWGAYDYSKCNTWERDGRPSYCRDINWITDDHLNGPAYTADQYLINGQPYFGRPNSKDKIESANPNDPNNLDSICFNNNCTNGVFEGKKAPNAPVISPPSTNIQLLTDADKYGAVYTGVTKVSLSNNQMTVTNCPTDLASCTTTTETIDKYPSGIPIIYAKNGTGCDPTYSPYNPTYPDAGPCGIVYVNGTYSRSLSVAAQADIIINGNVNKANVAPAPVLGLIANNFVRVEHRLVGTRPAGADSGDCPTPSSNNTELGGRSWKNIQIDAAILAIQHSFIVDNYDCGHASNLEKLHVFGAIAQNFRGTVGTGSGGGASTGYIKDYNYDDRFTVALPPYLFDIASSSWHISRESLCVPGGTASPTKC